MIFADRQLFFLLFGLVALGANAAPPPTPDFATDIKPLLTRYCYPCHGEKKKGGLDLRTYGDAAATRRAPEVFKKVLRNLEAHEMPPEERPQPTPAQRALITHWIEVEILGCDCAHPDPGRVTLRRLNRVEYNNTIRDLVGVTFHPADDFPADDVGYGFDNIGDVLSLSPLLLEKYLAAAEKILDAAIVATPTDTNALPESHRRIFFRPTTAETQSETARAILERFTRLAYRRPVRADEIARLMKLFDSVRMSRNEFESAIKVTLQAVLVSPHFLFRGDGQLPIGNAGAIHPVDDFAFASRLSYFLWSSMPDEELFALAGRGKLRKNLDAQVRRMLCDLKARALTDNFDGQWLQLRNLAAVAPDPKVFPTFDEPLRQAMTKETELFFEEIVRGNRSVLDFLEADYTFLNERLARHYGLAGIQGDDFRRVNLKRGQRGGVLTQASMLTVTSHATRTSPVKRGKWVLENILGTPPPPPPPDVPIFPEDAQSASSGTLRQRMERHRTDPTCASCHARMDPIGFGLENFDAIGAWREQEGDFPIDATGQLAGGGSFNSPRELKTMLSTTQREQFVRCFAKKLLTYALGRGLVDHDRCAVDEIAKAARSEHWRFSCFVLGVVKSAPFGNRRGEGERLAAEGGISSASQSATRDPTE